MHHLTRMYMHNTAECDDPKRVLHDIDPPDPRYQKEGIDQGDAEGGAAASCELSALKSQEHTNKHPRGIDTRRPDEIQRHLIHAKKNCLILLLLSFFSF